MFRREIIFYRKTDHRRRDFLYTYNEYLIETSIFTIGNVYLPRARVCVCVYVCEINRSKDCLSSVNMKGLIIGIFEGEILNYSECLIGLSACCSFVYVN